MTIYDDNLNTEVARYERAVEIIDEKKDKVDNLKMMIAQYEKNIEKTEKEIARKSARIDGVGERIENLKELLPILNDGLENVEEVKKDPEKLKEIVNARDSWDNDMGFVKRGLYGRGTK